MRLSRQSLRSIIMEELQNGSLRKNSRPKRIREGVSLDLGSIYDALSNINNIADEAAAALSNGEVEEAAHGIDSIMDGLREIMISIDDMGSGQPGYAAPYSSSSAA